MKKLITLLSLALVSTILSAQNDSTFIGVKVRLLEKISTQETIPLNYNFMDQPLIYIFIFLFALVIILNQIFPNLNLKSIQTLFLVSKFRQSLEKLPNLNNIGLLILDAITIITLPYLVVLSINQLTFNIDYYIRLLSLLLFIFSIEHIFNQLIILIFGFKELATYLNFILKLFLASNAFIITIIDFVITFSLYPLKTVALYIGIVYVIATYIFKALRQIQTFMDNGLSILYFILYLCTIEIIPVLLYLSIIKL